MDDLLGPGATYDSDDESMEQNESTKAEQGVEQQAPKKLC